MPDAATNYQRSQKIPKFSIIAKQLVELKHLLNHSKAADMILTKKFTPCGFPAEIKLDEPRTFLPIEAFVAWLLGRTFEKVIS